MSVYDFIADFLRRKNYTETLRAFEKEYSKPFANDVDENLEDIIADRYHYNQIHSAVDNLSLQDSPNVPNQELVKYQFSRWQMPYPTNTKMICKSINSLVVSTAITKHENTHILFVTTANSGVYLINIEEDEILLLLPSFFKCVIKKVFVVAPFKCVLVGMSGAIYLCSYDISKPALTVLSTHQAHPKMIIDSEIIGDKLLTLGWDKSLKAFRIASEIIPLASSPLSQAGSSIDVCDYGNTTYVVLGKVESTLLDVFILNDLLTLSHRISLNDAEFFVSSFTPRSIAIQYTHQQAPLVAVATSHEPETRVIVVPLLHELSASSSLIPIVRDQIIKNLSSFSLLDKYSQPLIAWKNSKSNLYGSIWFTGDDGFLRGIDLLSDSLAFKTQAHHGKIKTMCVYDDVIVTTGVDKAIILWD